MKVLSTTVAQVRQLPEGALRQHFVLDSARLTTWPVVKQEVESARGAQGTNQSRPVPSNLDGLHQALTVMGITLPTGRDKGTWQGTDQDRRNFQANRSVGRWDIGDSMTGVLRTLQRARVEHQPRDHHQLFLHLTNRQMGKPGNSGIGAGDVNSTASGGTSHFRDQIDSHSVFFFCESAWQPWCCAPRPSVPRRS